jgi:hypothetical protein
MHTYIHYLILYVSDRIVLLQQKRRDRFSVLSVRRNMKRCISILLAIQTSDRHGIIRGHTVQCIHLCLVRYINANMHQDTKRKQYLILYVNLNFAGLHQRSHNLRVTVKCSPVKWCPSTLQALNMKGIL